MCRVVITPLLLQSHSIGEVFRTLTSKVFTEYIYTPSPDTHTHLQSLTEDTPIFDHNWSGDHCSCMCVYWTCKVHHYTVNVLLKLAV